MKNMKKYLIAIMAGVMVTAASIPAFAAETISDVRLNILPDTDEMSPGDVYSGMEPEVYDGSYYVDEYDVSKSDPNPRSSYTYTIDILPEDGYKFDSNTKVSVYGATSVSVTSRKSSVLTVKVKTYPYHVLDEVNNIVINEAEEKATWDEVEYANKYSVIVYYTNKNGDERETKKTTTKESIDLGGYLGKYDDVTISVRALKGTSDGDKFVASSDYVRPDGTIDEDNSPEEYEFNIPTAHSDGTTSSNSSNNSNSSNVGPSVGPGSVNNQNDGWHGSGDNWYYIHNGKKVTGWLGINSEEWYLLDNNGTMLSGWQDVSGQRYLLNPNHDGTFGKMLSGWQLVNGKWYYLNTNHDGTFGAMLRSTTTPDGYRVGADGVWIQ